MKYIVLGGWIFSKNDGDRHYVSAWRVAQLYGVDPRLCSFLEGENQLEREFQGRTLAFNVTRLDGKDWPVLRPDPTGEYKLTRRLPECV